MSKAATAGLLMAVFNHADKLKMVYNMQIYLQIEGINYGSF